MRGFGKGTGIYPLEVLTFKKRTINDDFIVLPTGDIRWSGGEKGCSRYTFLELYEWVARRTDDELRVSVLEGKWRKQNDY